MSLKPEWSTKHDCCVCCGETQRKHKGRGYCSRCYDIHVYNRSETASERRARHRRHYHANKESINARKKAWRAKSKSKRGATCDAKWFRGVEVRDDLFGTGMVQDRARRMDGEWTVSVKFGDEVFDMPTRELARTGYWE